MLEPYGSAVIDTRELFVWMSRGVKGSSDAEARLQFFVSLHEVPVGAAGPEGPQLAVEKTVFTSLLERCMDELKNEAESAAEAFTDLVLEKGSLVRVELPALLASSRNEKFAGQLSAVL